MKQKIEGGGLATGAENYLKNRYNEDLKIVLEFVERWNKQDKEIEVAVAASNLKFLDLMDYKKKP